MLVSFVSEYHNTTKEPKQIPLVYKISKQKKTEKKKKKSRIITLNFTYCLWVKIKCVLDLLAFLC